MPVPNLTFPVLCFNQGVSEVVRDNNTLTICSAVGLKNGWYKGLLIVDSSGNAMRTKSARMLHGVGPFGGYNIFLGRRIKVELIFDGESFQMSIDDVRKRMLKEFKSGHGWKSRGDFDSLKESVEKAVTIGEIIRLVSG